MNLKFPTGHVHDWTNAPLGAIRYEQPKPVPPALLATVRQHLPSDSISSLAAALEIQCEHAEKAIRASAPILFACLAILASRPQGARLLEQVLARRHRVPLEAVTNAADYNGQRFVAAFGISVVRELLGKQACEALLSAIANYSGIANYQAGLVLGVVGALIVEVLRDAQHERSLTADQLAQLLSLQSEEIIAGIPEGFSARGTGLLGYLNPSERGQARRQASAESVPATIETVRFASVPDVSHDGAGLWARYGLVTFIALAMFMVYFFGDLRN